MGWLDWEQARMIVYPAIVLLLVVTGLVVLRRMGNRPDPLNHYGEGEDPRSREVADQLAARRRRKHKGASAAVKGAGGVAAAGDEE